jgi:hypothetical protein
MTVAELREEQLPLGARGRAYLTARLVVTAQPTDDTHTLEAKASCRTDDQTFVDGATIETFGLKAGESRAVDLTFFADATIPRPIRCELTTSVAHGLVVDRECMNAGVVTRGPCAGAVPPPVSEPPFTIDGPRLLRARATPQLRFWATVHAPIDPKARFNARASCQRDKAVESTSGSWSAWMDLVEPGDTLAAKLDLTDVDRDASPCSVELSYGDAVVGAWCVRADQPSTIGPCPNVPLPRR